MTRFPRLADVLGAPVETVTEEHLQAIIARAPGDGVHEEADLDFKQALYGKSEDLGADIAAMANTRGGVIIIGIAESDGAARSLTPVRIGDEEERRMRQMVADTVFPRVDYEIRRVASAADASNGLFLIMVQRSPLAPHAVRVNTGLRYYVRDGARNRPLAESEVADLYRNRFDQAKGQRDRVAEVEKGALDTGFVPSDWTTLTLVPTIRGRLQIRSGSIRSFRDWLLPFSHQARSLLDGPFWRSTARVEIGYRRVVVHGGRRPNGVVRGPYAELHTDGSGFIAIEKSREEQTVFVHDEWTLVSVFGMLNLLAQHALNSGGGGDALVRAALCAPNPGCTFKLGHTRQFGHWEELDDARPLTEVPTSTHVVELTSVATSAVERAIATRTIAADFLHAFGRPEVVQITDEGALRTRYWERDTLKAWKDAGDFDLDHSEVPYE